MDRLARVLIVEGDAGARGELNGLLAEATVRSAADGRSGLRLFYREHPDVVLLGLELPEVDGLEVLSTLRELSDVPVLIVADRSGVEDEWTGIATRRPCWGRRSS